MHTLSLVTTYCQAPANTPRQSISSSRLTLQRNVTQRTQSLKLGSPNGTGLWAAMTTSSSSVLLLRVLAHFFVISLFLAVLANAFDPLGIVYEVAGAGPRLVRRAGTLGGSTPAVSLPMC
ncbi:uncharacterized protein BDV14DRAFT_69554 [Aspergillus stella-maris]|uniref:uncharacterized protein n=1 Tax=Aspergillus stella-maris TaxID=1810926 RepID=UPI003CCCB92C